jgi:hypothetical protein
MTDSKAPQQTANTSIHQSLEEEEVKFIDVLEIIVKKKSLILFITSIGTLLTFSYYFLSTPIYRANISFVPPFQETYLLRIHPNLLSRTTRTIDTSLGKKENKGKSIQSSANILENLNRKNFLYHQFLTKIQSFTLQKEVLNKEKFIKGFLGDSFLGDSHESQIFNQKLISLHKAISLQISSKKKKYKLDTYVIDMPSFLAMTGPNPVVMAEFLNTLAVAAKAATISETQNTLQILIDNQLKLIKKEASLEYKAKNKEASLQHQTKLQLFSDSLKIAQKLHIKKNNFHELKEIFSRQSGVREHVETSKNRLFENYNMLDTGIIPHWFLYGEKALIEELKILNSRTNQFLDDSHELVQNQNIKNSKSGLLKTNVATYSKYLAELEEDIKQLQSINVSTLIPNVVSITQQSIPPDKPINLNIERIFSAGIGLSLLFGVIVAFLSHAMGIIRDRNN